MCAVDIRAKRSSAYHRDRFPNFDRYDRFCAAIGPNGKTRVRCVAVGFLTRDPRMKERKKYGLEAARRAPQFSKR